MADDLFDKEATRGDYSAKDIEVLEGLEPVRMRPGMYIGGTDERAMHHLAAEVLDNSMDEAVAGHATRIEMQLQADGTCIVRDNGRGIPVDPHPKFPKKSALEVILTTLHSGGKFSGKAYQTSGGLHGVGVSVVNALSEWMDVEVAREKKLHGQSFSQGKALGRLETRGAAPNRRGTTVAFRPDPAIFGSRATLKPARLYKMAKSKAYLYRGVEIRWSCASELLKEDDPTPVEETLHFPNGLEDFLKSDIGEAEIIGDALFCGKARFEEKYGADTQGSAEWALAWLEYDDGFSSSYCNTIPTPQGGTHENGLRYALTRAARAYGDLVGNKKASQITADDVFSGCRAVLSVFIHNPEFQGQTKEKLSTADAVRLVEGVIRDHFDNWLAADPKRADALLELFITRADERLKRKAARDTARKSATKKLRLPGKLADCSGVATEGSEIFLVEGDSAGGSAKQARDRKKQAILPLRGKILNVASAGVDKLSQNQELQDLLLALGVGTGRQYRDDDLRYDRVIIMTDADVDGAHIASLLLTFFYLLTPHLIRNGHLFLAAPPLYKISQGTRTVYAQDDKEKDHFMETLFASGKGKIEVSRFKGLGEMMPKQLKETTMDPDSRQLLRVYIPEGEDDETEDLVERLMGKKPELRFEFIRENAQFFEDIDI